MDKLQTVDHLRRIQQKAPLTLKEGQIVRGKVIKFFPENKAMIHLGNKQVIAQLERHLQVNNSYLFRVNQTHPQITLQVFSDKVVKKKEEAAAVLLERLGLKSTHTRLRVVSAVLREQIPLRLDMLLQAFDLLEKQTDSKAEVVLIELLKRGLPVKQQVLNGLTTHLFPDISMYDQLEIIYKTLQRNGTGEGYSHQLRSLLSLFFQNEVEPVSSALTKQIYTELERQSDTTFRLLQNVNWIKSDVSFGEWQQQWKDYHLKQSENLSNLPYQLGQVDELLKTFMSHLQFTEHDGEQVILRRWIVHGLMSSNFLRVTTTEQFFFKIRWLIDLLRPNRSNVWRQDYPFLLNLLQLVSQQVPMEQQSLYSKAMDLLNGIHFASTETREEFFLQIPLPNTLFGMGKDAYMTYEGKKDENRRISSDYCHIVFYLMLGELRETIIDLNIQNRNIFMVIHNEEPNRIQASIQMLEKTLKDRIKQVGYTLTYIRVTTLDENEENVQESPPKWTAQGVDFKI
ncbi:hypothetical protein [Salirhabdus salicampi]|uniref:hypothetical protein n=1 Tax=Salirhabdus salicampi TaxID=476102 RepID=UPI0020C49726|nr:hypothetical protein [Salirhabdus salicampi]MCP8616538.1 hypothetical protein [Salirhabdus salicampi]